MPRIDNRLIRQRIDLCFDRLLEYWDVASQEILTPDAPIKNNIANDLCLCASHIYLVITRARAGHMTDL